MAVRLTHRRHAEDVVVWGLPGGVTAAGSGKKRAQARSHVAAGVDPSAVRKATKGATPLTFGAMAREWMEQQRPVMAPATFEKAEWMLDQLARPWLKDRPIAALEPPEVLDVLRWIEDRGCHETAHRTKQRIGQVCRYAIATGRARRDPTADLRGALAPKKVTPRAALTDAAQVRELLIAIDGFEGTFVVESALRFAPHVFVRPGQLRKAEWSEFDLDAAEWRIPAERMKMRSLHLVPLSTQAVAMLRDLYPLTSDGRYVFPSLRTRARPMSENTINVALRRIGHTATEHWGTGSGRWRRRC